MLNDWYLSMAKWSHLDGYVQAFVKPDDKKLEIRGLDIP